MIKFFRKIRQGLLAESKFSKYMIYALGEIVLVVIGILIAININAWNEDRDDRAKEQQLLQSFRTDLIANRIELERVMSKSDETACLADSLLMFKRGELQGLGRAQLDLLILDATGFTVYQTHEGTVQDILGSGILDIIENDSIRLSIGSWQANLKLIREFERLDRASSDDYMNYIKEHLDLYNVREEGGMLRQESDMAVFDDRVFLNHLSARKRMPTILNNLYQEELPTLNRLISEVSRELEQ